MVIMVIVGSMLSPWLTIVPCFVRFLPNFDGGLCMMGAIVGCADIFVTGDNRIDYTMLSPSIGVAF